MNILPQDASNRTNREAPFPENFRSMEDIATFLKDNFSPQCIKRGESPNDAHRRAGEVGLAMRIVATIEREPNGVDDEGVDI